MNRIAEVKQLFRTINDGLSRIEEMPMSERTRTIQGLILINEELCDYVADLVKYLEKNERKAV
jgi:hypothetical protein